MVDLTGAGCAQINKNPSTGRIPLGEADMNTADCTLREGALAAAAMAQKTPRSAVRPPPVKRSAAPAPAPPAHARQGLPVCRYTLSADP